MTPKEKAFEIYWKYYKIFHIEPFRVNISFYAQQCALIAVDEMIKMYNEMNENGFLKPNSVGFILNDVKNEIEKL